MRDRPHPEVGLQLAAIKGGETRLLPFLFGSLECSGFQPDYPQNFLDSLLENGYIGM